MDAYTIVVMDYESGSLRFFHFDYEPEDPEAWLQTHDPAWNESQCYWMGVKDSEVGETHEWIN
jgi:hypothetical protein